MGWKLGSNRVLSPSQLHGMLRVILEPLIGNVPIVGALTMFFIRRPVSVLWHPVRLSFRTSQPIGV